MKNSISVEDAYIAKELSAAINRFLAGLRAEDRFLFVRRYWAGDELAELAVQLQMSCHRISVRLSRIRNKLRATLKKEGLLP